MLRPFLCTLIATTALAAQAQNDDLPLVRLGLSNAIGSMTSEAVLDLSAGTPGDDALDVPTFTDEESPTMYIATLAVDGSPLAYNAYGPTTSEVTAMVQLAADQAGTYTVRVLEMGSLPTTTCVKLIDLTDGSTLVLSEGLEFTVDLPAGAPTGPRYKMQVSTPAALGVTASCPDQPSGLAHVAGSGPGPWTVGLFDATGALVTSMVGQGGPVTIESIGPGNWSVQIVHPNGCPTLSFPFVMDALPAIEGSLQAPTTAYTDQPITFSSDADPSVLRLWDFGDASGSFQPAPVHAYQQPGSYTVKLKLDNGVCEKMLTQVIEVSQNTVGLAEVTGSEVRAWSAGGTIAITNPLQVSLHVHVYDATGRTVRTLRVPARTGRMEVPTTGWTNGVYYLNASSPWEQWTFSLPVAE